MKSNETNEIKEPEEVSHFLNNKLENVTNVSPDVNVTTTRFP